MPSHDKLLEMKRPITLQEHMQSIASSGGKARAAILTAEQLSEIGRKAGRIGGRARSQKLSKARRSEIARNAAQKRWAKAKKTER